MIRGEIVKAFHVSPLMDMEHTYDWRSTEPGQRVQVHIDSRSPDAGTTDFDATLSLERLELSRASTRHVLDPLPRRDDAGDGEDLLAVAPPLAEGCSILPTPGARMNERRLDTLARRAGHAMLRKVIDGCLEVTEGGRDDDVRLAIVRPAGARGDPRPEGVDRRSCAARTDFAQGYIDRLWTTDDPVGVVRVAARSMGPLDRMRKRWHFLLGRAEKLARLVPRNTKEGARHNISAHYDLGNDLFASFLDERLMYSSAYYPSPDASLEDAQTEKLDRLCRQLKLEPDDHLIEIGTGWGGMAIYAAARVRMPGDDHDDLEGAARVRDRAGRRRGALRSDHGRSIRTTATCGGSSRSSSRSR